MGIDKEAWGLDENGCAPDCPIRILGEQSGERKSGSHSEREMDRKAHGMFAGGIATPDNWYGDTGTAARFFAQFYPHDETPQERGETPVLKSDEPQYDDDDLPLDQVLHGDCLDVLRTLPSNSVHAIVTDPPAGISFMLSKQAGRTWDSDKGGRDQWIAWLTDIAVEAKRVLCAGGHAFVWALPRTSHWTATALENAGFEIRDEVSHLFGSDTRVQSFMASLDEEQRNAFAQIVDGMGAPAATLACFGSGFPKSLDLGKQLDKLAPRRGMFSDFAAHFKKMRLVSGLSQKQIALHFPSKTGGMTGCVWNWENGANVPTLEQWHILQPMLHLSDEWTPLIEREEAEREVIGHSENGQGQGWAKQGLAGFKPEYNITAPATDLAKKYSGFGSALKPSHENWLLVRKPLAEKTIAAQVLATGTGALNIDISRIGSGEDYQATARVNPHRAGGVSSFVNDNVKPGFTPHPQGKRFPSNTLFSHTERCQARGEKRVRGSHNAGKTWMHTKGQYNAYGEYGDSIGHGYADSDGMEVVQDYECAPDCPVFLLGEQSGERKNGGPVYTRDKARDNGFLSGRPSIADNRFAGDTGRADRYFKCFPPAVEDMIPYIYTSKSSRRERNEGCEALPEHKRDATHLDGAGSLNYRIGEDGKITPKATPSPEGNHHPTVKPLSLMSYLIRMITPPNGIVLDMFAGSGTTGVAAVQCGFHYILIEQEQEYIDICRARLAHAHAGSPSRPSHPSQPKPVRVYGDGSSVGKKASRCPEHDVSYPGGSNCYSCGCSIVYTKKSDRDTTPATRERPVDTRPTLWEEVV